MGELPRRDLELGATDIAIAGFFQNIPGGYYRQKIFEESYISALRRSHPALKAPMTLKKFLELGHILISPQGDLDGQVDKVLAKRGLKRRIVAGIANFNVPGAIVANSDLILTGPRSLIASYCAQMPVVMVEPPIPIPGFSVVQVWHERTHRDPLCAWVRELIARFSKQVWAGAGHAS
jgi:DNA-binding transcriptional LysR family regulator